MPRTRTAKTLKEPKQQPIEAESQKERDESKGMTPSKILNVMKAIGAQVDELLAKGAVIAREQAEGMITLTKGEETNLNSVSTIQIVKRDGQIDLYTKKGKRWIKAEATIEEPHGEPAGKKRVTNQRQV
mmetsp:Transcript_14033/g.12011  ORF Transcript_14033/g.12011 Transcript_14033/m.12011 type:complete len:129 (+) Transcript_14033:455-841(+)